MRADNRFFTLRSWRANAIEEDLIHRVYSTNLLTPRERQTLAVYHVNAYLRLQALHQHRIDLINLAPQLLLESVEEDARTNLIPVENHLVEAIRNGWAVFDSIAHEINLICWKKSKRKELFHPYIQEKKISFYMVREKLLRTKFQHNNHLCELLATETRENPQRSEHYILLSNLATRILHRPLLLGCHYENIGTADNPIPHILLADNPGMPGESFQLQDIDIIARLTDIEDWLTGFIDRIYQALTELL